MLPGAFSMKGNLEIISKSDKVVSHTKCHALEMSILIPAKSILDDILSSYILPGDILPHAQTTRATL